MSRVSFVLILDLLQLFIHDMHCFMNSFIISDTFQHCCNFEQNAIDFEGVGLPTIAAGNNKKLCQLIKTIRLAAKSEKMAQLSLKG